MKNLKGVKYEDAKVLRLSWSTMLGASWSAVFLSGTSTVLGIVTGGPGDERNAQRVKITYAIAEFQIYSAALRRGLIKPWWKFW
jgi:hypothetical protein